MKQTLPPNEGSMGTNIGGQSSMVSSGAPVKDPSRSPQTQGEKKFEETTTGEKLIINFLGAFASLKMSDKYIPVKTFQQLLYPPFSQVNEKNGTPDQGKSTPGASSNQTLNRRSNT